MPINKGRLVLRRYWINTIKRQEKETRGTAEKRAGWGGGGGAQYMQRMSRETSLTV